MALVVFTGGARSGKSTAAADLARRRALDGQHVVVAVFGRESDAEMSERIARHREDRPAEFETLAVDDVRRFLEDVPADALLVVDCLGTAVGRVMEDVGALHGATAAEPAAEAAGADASDAAVTDAATAREVGARVEALVASIAARAGDTIVVTNEVGDGVVPAFASGRLFRDVLGAANRGLVAAADAAYLCVAGRLLDLGKQPRQASWPRD